MLLKPSLNESIDRSSNPRGARATRFGRFHVCRELAKRHPEVAARCAARSAFMRETIGMDVPETLLPLADTCGIVAPFLFEPTQVVAL